MDFDVENDLAIFDELLKNRPEIKKEALQKDLTTYYLPYINKIVELLKHKRQNISDGLVVGISAIQGAGKTTQDEIIGVLIKHFGFNSVSLSIDDHYITHQELCILRQKDPRFIRRGVTHDLPLAILNLRDLAKMEPNEPIIVSGYDKGANLGDGERFRWVNLEGEATIQAKVVSEDLVVNKESLTTKALQLVSLTVGSSDIPLPERMGGDIPLVEHLLPKELIGFLQINPQDITISEQDHESLIFSANNQSIQVPKENLPNGWQIISKKPDFIFYDGWMLGARMVEDESVFEANLPALETPEAQQFAKDVNKKLEDYELLWQMVEFMNVLYVPNYQMSLQWRDQAEDDLRAKGEGMSSEQIKDFVHYFWRSVHPAIHIKNLSRDPVHTKQVTIINDDHTIKEVLSPEEVASKYP